MVLKDCGLIIDHRDKPIILRQHTRGVYLEFCSRGELFNYIPVNLFETEILSYEILDTCTIITIPQGI